MSRRTPPTPGAARRSAICGLLWPTNSVAVRLSGNSEIIPSIPGLSALVCGPVCRRLPVGEWGVSPMRWVRSSRRFGAWLALAALVLQLAVSFGHVHLDGAPRAAIVDAAAAAPGSAPLPDQQPGDHAHDYCAICAAIHLAAGVFVPPAPQVEAPFASQPIEHIDRVTTAFVSARRAPFQSRAPPSA